MNHFQAFCPTLNKITGFTKNFCFINRGRSNRVFAQLLSSLSTAEFQKGGLIGKNPQPLASKNHIFLPDPPRTLPDPTGPFPDPPGVF